MATTNPIPFLACIFCSAMYSFACWSPPKCKFCLQDSTVVCMVCGLSMFCLCLKDKLGVFGWDFWAWKTFECFWQNFFWWKKAERGVSGVKFLLLKDKRAECFWCEIYVAERQQSGAFLVWNFCCWKTAVRSEISVAERQQWGVKFLVLKVHRVECFLVRFMLLKDSGVFLLLKDSKVDCLWCQISVAKRQQRRLFLVQDFCCWKTAEWGIATVT